VLAAVQRWWEAYHDRDTDAVRAALAPDVVVVDHRSTSSLPVLDGIDAYVPALEHLWRLAPDVRVTGGWLALDAHGGVLRARRWGPLSDGGAVDDAMINLFVVADERVQRIEGFDDGDIEAALARFAELGGSGRVP
jgi:ketosteroid isomerase-like protein